MLKGQWGTGQPAAGFAIKLNDSYLFARNSNGSSHIAFIPSSEFNTGYIANAMSNLSTSNILLPSAAFATNGSTLVTNFISTGTHFTYNVDVPNGVGKGYGISFLSSNTTYFNKYLDKTVYGNNHFVAFNISLTTDYTNNNYVYVTQDAHAEPWDEYAFPSPNVRAATYASDVKLFAAATNSSFLTSDNNGETWTFRSNSLPGSGVPTELVYNDSLNAFYLMLGLGTLYYSTNNGSSWSNVTTSLPSNGGMNSMTYDEVNGRIIIGGSSFVNESPAPANQVFPRMIYSTGISSFSSTDVTGSNIVVDAVVTNNDSNNQRFIATGSGYDFSKSPTRSTTTEYLYSTDGTSWTVGTLNFPISTVQFGVGAVYYSGKKYD